METAAPTPLSSPGRVVDVIDRTFRIYRNNFVIIVVLVALITIPVTLFQYYALQHFTESAQVTYGETFAEDLLEYFVLLLGITLVGTALEVIVIDGTLTVIASENYLGRRISLGEAFGLARGRFLTLTGAVILYGIIYIVIFAAVAISGSMCVVPFILMPVVSYLALASYFFIAPVIMLENVGAGFGLRRALELGKVRFWSAFGFIIAIWIITAVINTAFGSANSVLTFSSVHTSNLVSTILSTLIKIFIAPIMPIGLTLMYYNIRTRVEGLDLALLAVGKPDPRPSDIYSPAPAHGLITGQDVGNILILVGVFVALICGMWFITLMIGSSISTY